MAVDEVVDGELVDEVGVPVVDQVAPHPVAPSPTIQDDDSSTATGFGGISAAQSSRIHTMLPPMTDEARHELFARIVGRPITSANQLTRPEANLVIEYLTAHPEGARCTKDQREMIGRALKAAGNPSQEETLGLYESITGHAVAKTADLTIAEARQVLAALDVPMFPAGDPR